MELFGDQEQNMEEQKLRQVIREEASKLLQENVEEDILDYDEGLDYALALAGFSLNEMTFLGFIDDDGPYALMVEGRPNNYPFKINQQDFDRIAEATEHFDYIYEMQVLQDGKVRMKFAPDLPSKIKDAFPPKFFMRADKR